MMVGILMMLGLLVLFLELIGCLFGMSDLVPPWLAIGRLRVELRCVGEFGRAFRAATVFVTKSASFHPKEKSQGLNIEDLVIKNPPDFL